MIKKLGFFLTFFEDKKTEFENAKKTQEQRFNDNANVFSWDEEE